MSILSDIPTERAMKEMNKYKVPDSVRKCIEVMAIHKTDIISVIIHMRIRENIARRVSGALMSDANKKLDNYLREIGNQYEVTITPK